MKRFLQRIEDIFASGKTLEEIKSEYNYLEVIRQRNRLVLNSRNTNYSFGGLHKVFQQAFDKTELDVRNIRKALILGFGAGSVASILRDELKCKCEITGVEIDPEVIRLAKEYFGLEESGKMKIVIDDAEKWVAGCKEHFDLIAVDLFLDHKIPETFDSPEFLEKIKQLLNPNGSVYYNRLLFDYESKVRTARFEKDFEKIFPVSDKITIRKPSRNVVFAGKV